MAEARESGITWGAAMRGLSGDAVHGDRSVVVPRRSGFLVAVIDGLGHGQEAARAADRAVRVVSSFEGTDLVELMQICHRELRESRGVVMTVAALSIAEGTLATMGVGNVQGVIMHAIPVEGRRDREFVLLRGGVLGHVLPPLRQAVSPLHRGDMLILATDGVGTEFTTEEYREDAPQALADGILERYGLATDDALVLVVRYGDA